MSENASLMRVTCRRLDYSNGTAKTPFNGHVLMDMFQRTLPKSRYFNAKVWSNTEPSENYIFKFEVVFLYTE